MDRLQIDDVEITYEVRGRGEQMVVLHASPFVEWYDPLIDHLPELAVLRYRRRPASQPEGGFPPLTIADDARLCVQLMDHVGFDRAHVVGHSYGGLLALQLGLDAPGRVRSLSLLEPAASGILPTEQVGAEVVPIVDAYRNGDTETAVDRFLRMVCGPDYRALLEAAVPGAFATALANADVFFQVEMPALRQWSFGAADAQRVTQPVLNVRGGRSVPRFVAASDAVQAWFPAAETLSLADVGHLLMVEQPETLARGLTEFIGRVDAATS